MTNTEKLSNAIIAADSIMRRRTHCIMAVCREHNINENEAYIINYLCTNKDKDIFQRDLEHEFNQRRSTVSGIVKEMESKGLVIRTSVITDARLKKVFPTDKAHVINDSLMRAVNKFSQKAESVLSDFEIDTLCNAIDKMYNTSFDI